MPHGAGGLHGDVGPPGGWPRGRHAHVGRGGKVLGQADGMRLPPVQPEVGAI